MNNLTVVGIGITVIWLAVFAYYFYVSRKQSEIIEDVEELKEVLEASENVEQS